MLWTCIWFSIWTCKFCKVCVWNNWFLKTDSSYRGQRRGDRHCVFVCVLGCDGCTCKHHKKQYLKPFQSYLMISLFQERVWRSRNERDIVLCDLQCMCVWLFAWMAASGNGVHLCKARPNRLQARAVSCFILLANWFPSSGGNQNGSQGEGSQTLLFTVPHEPYAGLPARITTKSHLDFTIYSAKNLNCGRDGRKSPDV